MSGDDAYDQSALEESVARPTRRRRIYLVALLAFIALIGLAWTQRTKFADNLVRRELERLDIPARYRIEEIGLRTQKLRDLVIGDPDDPDLTAGEVDVIFKIDLTGITLRSVRAKDVWLKGGVVDGKLTLGELDKFRDPTSKEPLGLPDIFAEIEKARARIDTPYGRFGIALSGQGHFRSGFSGQGAIAARKLALGDCRIATLNYNGAISVRELKPQLHGPAILNDLSCPKAKASLARAALDLNVSLNERFDNWRGVSGTRLTDWRIAQFSGRSLTGPIRFYGNADRTQFETELALHKAASDPVSLESLRIKGDGQAGFSKGRVSVGYVAHLAVSGGAVRPATLAAFKRSVPPFAGTPVGPLRGRLVDAAIRAGRSFAADAEVTYGLPGGRHRIDINGLAVQSGSGAALTARDRISIVQGEKGWTADLVGLFQISGGGFPSASLRLGKASGQRTAGRFNMARFEAGGSMLAVPDLRFSPVPGGYRYEGQAVLSGPLAGGRIDRASIPLSGSLGSNGSFTYLERCGAFDIESLSIAGLTFSKQRLALCPDGGAVFSNRSGRARLAGYVPSPVLMGRMGTSPASFSAARLDFTDTGFATRNFAVRLSQPDDPIRFDAAQFGGLFASNGLAGGFSGARGKIRHVPLLLENAAGRWSLAGGIATAQATGTLLDDAQVDRFMPLQADAIDLVYRDSVLSMTGLLHEPVSKREVAKVALTHRFSSGSGEAALTTEGLVFDDLLQPDMLTPLALGIVANVQGQVDGNGRIAWDGKGVSSSGEYRTDGANLAAAFGPVTGLSGTIRFSDLLGLQTAPGQEIRLGSVNPGIAVIDGVVRYQLLPDNKVHIEGGRWPFAGGELVLLPTTLDLGVEKARYLTFEMHGLDAAKFLNEMEFENLNASGMFDGQLPMIFDADGGRILNGTLVSREGGGTIAYVGELTYKDLSPYGNFAFNALKSIRYKSLTVVMNGEIDGEIITDVRFSGLQQGEGTKQNYITRQLAKLPIQFNVKITAPFMQLLSSVRGYYDPSLLVGQNLPLLIEEQRAAEEKEKAAKTIVQPNESGAMR